MIHVVSDVYSYLAKRKALLVLIICSIAGCCALLLASMSLEERITYLLPDDKNALSTDLERIQSAPLQRKLLITLHAGNADTAGAELALATEELAKRMDSAFFKHILYKPDTLNPNFFIALRDMVPSLFDTTMQQDVESYTNPRAVNTKLIAQKKTLSTIEGVIQAPTIAADPLSIHRTALGKMKSLAYMKNLRVLHGVYMTEDARHSLIMAETLFMAMDSGAAVKLEQELTRLSATLPDGITWTVLGAQRYTAANASTIKQDIARTSIIAGVLLLAIVLCFLRTKQLFFLLLLPVLAYGGGAAAVAAGWKPASAMTFGFGPILVGMTIDFGLHLYYVLGTKSASKQELLRKATAPIAISGLTTIAAFSLLMLSPVPGLRQLSVFITTGLFTALVVTLFVLPHFISGHAGRIASHPLPYVGRTFRARIIVCSVLLVCVGIFGSSKLSFQDHIRALGVRPQELLDAEKITKQVWGPSTGEAMLFASGTTVDDAVRGTQASLDLLSENNITNVIGLTPLLPPQQVQTANQQNWKNFWAKHSTIPQAIQEKGTSLGFSKNAFEPFYTFVRTEPAMITLGTLQQLGMGNIVDALLIQEPSDNTQQHEHNVTLISYLPDSGAVNALFTPEVEKKYGVRLISLSRLGSELAEVLTGTFAQFIVYALCIITCVIALVLRKPKQCVCALLPACFGLLMMGGVLGLLGRQLSLFSIAGALLVLGHGVDYGVYAMHAIQKSSRGTSQAILVSGLTSLAGFGALLFADHPAMFDMGLSVFSGLLAAMPCALLLLPALFSKETTT